MTFLLPVIHTILKAVDEMEDKSLMNRSIGSLAIIIAPTRELATQIFSIVESVLQYSNAGIKSIDRIDSNISEVDTAAAPTFKKHWIVPGLLIGGAKKSSDKARIRKGINILVATPGRLLDHLKTTVSFEAGNLRWIILDEADRLLELGFQDTLHEILQILDIKRGVAVRNQSRLKVECWPAKRQTVLCSATLSDGVTELAKSKLVDPVMINQDDLDKKVVRPVSLKDSVVKDFSEKVAEKVVEKAKINEDAQIKKQDAIIKESAKETEKSKSIELKSGDKLIKSVVTKEKIVEKKLATKSADDSSKKESNALIAKAKPIVESDREENSSDSSQDSDQEDETEYIDEKPRNNLDIPKQLSQKYMIAPAKQRLALLVSILRHKSLENKKKKTECKIMVFFDSCDSVDFYHYLLTNGSKETTGSLIPTKILKLHGNLDQKVRSSTMNEYKALETSIMFCTDVAGRGLDVANVSLIIQYDPPSNIQDYVHRVGRTARLGRHGESIIFILPSEVGFIDLLIGNGVSGLSRIEAASAFKYLVSSDDFTGLMKRDSRVEVVATDLHMMLERFVLSDETARKMAMSAFSSHVKAYATHSESEIFHLKKLHLGHVCKSFGLRDAPNHANSFGGKQIKKDLDAKDGKCGYSTFKRKSDYLIRDCKNEFSDGGVKRIIVDGDDRTVVKRQRMKKIY